MAEQQWARVLDALLTGSADADAPADDTVTRLRERTGYDAETVERELATLERWGLIDREAPETDEGGGVDVTRKGFDVAHQRTVGTRQYQVSVLVGVFAFVVAFSSVVQLVNALFRLTWEGTMVLFAAFLLVLAFVVVVGIAALDG